MIKFIIPTIIVFLIVLFWEKIQKFFFKKFNIRLNYIVLVIFIIILTIVMALLYFSFDGFKNLNFNIKL